MVTRWRRRLARWIDPDTRSPALPAELTPPDSRQMEGPWQTLCDQFALRILAVTYQITAQLETLENDEQDPDRLHELYKLDHASTRARRHAENLQVLSGRRIEDTDKQVASLLDIVRAGASAIEYYSRVSTGRVVELAVVEFAADDVIRLVTELLDNATRFSPPTSPVTVSAHLTEQGSVLLRIEDGGIGIEPDQLAALNAMLVADQPAALDGEHAAHLGLVVVQRLARAHGIRVHLTCRQQGGTTTTVLLPEAMLCELPWAPIGVDSAAGSPPVADQHRTTAKPPEPAVAPHQNSATGSGSSRLALVDEPSPRTACPATQVSVDGATSSGLPRRVRNSVRESSEPLAPAPTPAQAPGQAPGQGGGQQTWPDDVAAFAAGANDAQHSAPQSEGGTQR